MVDYVCIINFRINYDYYIITLQPRYNAPRYNAVSVITLSRDGSQFLATKMHYNWNKSGFMNNSIHLNLLCFKLLSRESETEHHAACSAVVVDWSAPVVKSIFGIGSLHVKCCLNASWPYWEMSDNDAVHVKSPTVCRATLQGWPTALHPVCQQSAVGPPADWLLNASEPPTLSSTVQVTWSDHSSVAQPAWVLYNDFASAEQLN